jgi:hypothetical protein
LGWLSKLSDLHVKCATLFERVGNLSDSVEGLSDDLHDVSVRVGRVEGAIVNSSTPEVLRQLADIQSRLSTLEARSRMNDGEVIPSIVLSKASTQPQMKLAHKPPSPSEGS